MSDPFNIAARGIRYGRRICADCGARYQLGPETTVDTECCDACGAIRGRMMKRLADKFHLVPKEGAAKARQEVRQKPTALQKCSDCGKEFKPSLGGLALDSCCDECHSRRVTMAGDVADKSLRGRNPARKQVARKQRSLEPSKQTPFLKTILVLLTVLAVFSVGPAERYYRQWREMKLLQEANASFTKSDYQHAILGAKNALTLNPDNPKAIRIAAKSYLALRSPQALAWLARLNQLTPDDWENALDWAGAALQSGNCAMTDRILSEMSEPGRNTARFHHFSALVALHKLDAAKALLHWSEAAKLSPDDELFKLNVAVAKLDVGTVTDRVSALEVLGQLRVSSPQRLPALRALLADAIRRDEKERAKDLAFEIGGDPKAPFVDKLLRLSALRSLKDPGFDTVRAGLETEATDRENDAYELLIWMNRNGYSKDVPAVLPRIRGEFLARPPVSIAVADSFAVAEDWTGLQETVRDANWLQADYLRLATLAWALDRSGNRTGSASVWKNAMTAAGNRADQMENLARAAIDWGLDQRAEEALWNITTHSAQVPSSVLQSLWIRSFNRGDTNHLRDVAGLLLRASPKSVVARRNYVFLSLLKRTDEGRPQQAAEALYKENPLYAPVVITYGLSLFQSSRARAASELMETLPPAQLREPSNAIYYGMFLAGARQTAKSEEYLQLGEHWPLLPEEEALLGRR